MTLVAYKKKRDFKKTPEPAGKTGPRRKSELRYLIQKHDASHLHYDFRLEWDGTLKSWAVPKGPSLDPDRKALAVQVEDHPLDYGSFEGVIPKGQYGGGTVLLWDEGTWEPLEDPAEGFKSGKLKFELHGQKLKGSWALVRMHDGKNWLLIKHKDEYSGKRDILAEQPESVASKRSIDQIAQDRDDVWNSKEGPAKTVKGASKSAMPDKLVPQLAVLAEHPPEGEEWLHEIKFDGYRLLAFIKNGKVTLRTRTGADWTAKFAPIERSLAKLSADTAILDGEAVVLNERGQSDFQALQQMFKSEKKANLHYYVFDMPFLNGQDLRSTPLLERKELLKALLEKSKLPESTSYSDHVTGHGDAVIEKACAIGSEGIVSKRVDAKYESRRAPTWVKSKCTQGQEFVIIGFVMSEKRTEGFRSLLLGYYDAKKKLTYAGRVGTGFDAKLLKDLRAKLEKLERKTAPTDVLPPVRERRAARWVEPKMVCEVRFTGWTSDGVLRHPAFMGLRLDKPADEVKREKPVLAKKVQAEADEELVEKPESTPEPKKAKERASKKAKVEKKGEGEKQAAGELAVRLTHPDKILYPEEKLTKRDLAEYYEFVQQWLLPHAVERPLALVRCPAGLVSKCFFMRNWSSTLPAEIDKVRIGKGKDEWHVMIHDVRGLLSLVQISAMEIHTWNCKADDIEQPDQLVFDLDPGPDVAWKQVVKGAELLRQMLKEIGMPSFLKTSGGKGLHIAVPIVPSVGWDQVKSFCKTLAEHQSQQADFFVTNMRKDLRGGKIYLDYLRNGRGATAVVAYGARARPGAAVSMPIAWEEAADLKSATDFTLKNARRYLEKRKRDPWSGFEDARVDLADVALGKVAPR